MTCQLKTQKLQRLQIFDTNAIFKIVVHFFVEICSEKKIMGIIGENNYGWLFLKILDKHGNKNHGSLICINSYKKNHGWLC